MFFGKRMDSELSDKIMTLCKSQKKRRGVKHHRATKSLTARFLDRDVFIFKIQMLVLFEPKDTYPVVNHKKQGKRMISKHVFMQRDQDQFLRMLPNANLLIRVCKKWN